MYKIVNYDRFWSYDRPFNTFQKAFEKYEHLNLENEPSNKIIYFDGENEEVMYCPTWKEKYNIANEIPTNIMVQ